MLFIVVVNQREHLLDDVAVVAQTRHFALSAEFSGRLEPAVEKPGRRVVDSQPVEEDITASLCLIVGVDCLQSLVECAACGTAS